GFFFQQAFGAEVGKQTGGADFFTVAVEQGRKSASQVDGILPGVTKCEFIAVIGRAVLVIVVQGIAANGQAGLELFAHVFLLGGFKNLLGGTVDGEDVVVFIQRDQPFGDGVVNVVRVDLTKTA